MAQTPASRPSSAPPPPAPWLAHYDPGVPAHLTYDTGTLAQALEAAAGQHGNHVAYDYMGARCTYGDLLAKVGRCARAFLALGVRPGDRVTLCLPNCPQNVIAFYALNLVGAVAVMVHPLSAEREIAFYLKDSASVAAVTLEQFYPKFARLGRETALPALVVTSPADELSFPVRLGHSLLARCRGEAVPRQSPALPWREFLRRGAAFPLGDAKRQADDDAVILYSGGTTGTAKGILLTNGSCNALAAQI